MLDRHVIREGTLILRGGTIYVGHDWQIEGGPVMCREHCILACLHTAQRLLQEASKDIAAPGGSNDVVSDLPDEATMRALIEESQSFP